MKIALTNRSSFLDADLRKLIRAALRATGCVALPLGYANTLEVRVTWTRGRHPSGLAYLGKGSRSIGHKMILRFPHRRAWTEDTWRECVAVTAHECMHLRGADHSDMTDAQRRCTLPLPAWASGLELRDKPPAPTAEERRRDRAERRAARRPERVETVRKRLEEAKSRERKALAAARRAKTIRTKWTRRLAALEAAERKAER